MTTTMTRRVAHKILNMALENLKRALGRTDDKLRFSYSPEYGGWVIEDDGQRPFGNTRWSAKDMLAAINMTILVIQSKKEWRQ
jgi:hypothetical protein